MLARGPKPKQEAFLEFDGGPPLYFDVVASERLTHSAEVTSHPVESGSAVSDHIRNELDTISLEIFVSNTPIKDVNSLWNGQIAGLDLPVPKADKPVAFTPGGLTTAAFGAISSLLNGPEQWKAVVLQFPEKFDQVGFVLSQLLDYLKRGVVGRCITPHRTYPAVVLTRVETNRDATTGDGCPITLELKEIRLVEARIISAPVPTETRGATMKRKGRQPTSFVRDDSPKIQSFAVKLKEGLEKL